MVIDRIKNILRSSTFEPTEWCTAHDMGVAVRAIEEQFLDERAIAEFLARNDFSPLGSFKVGVVCAGNLPLVGFGDMFYAMLAGGEVWLKPSRRDPTMCVFAPLVHLVDDVAQLAGMDALLVMGSDETCATLRARFPNMPMLLRSSRHSVAVLTGRETADEMAGLADDMFLYCGRGCRSVSHLYLPSGFDPQSIKLPERAMPKAWTDAYRYERAMATMRGESFVDGGYYLLKHGPWASTSIVGYTFYDTAPPLDAAKIQCVVGAGHIPFGRAQFPTLLEFADGVSPIAFMANVMKSLRR